MASEWLLNIFCASSTFCVMPKHIPGYVPDYCDFEHILRIKGISDERQSRPILSADKIVQQKFVMLSCKNHSGNIVS